jgi:hypothetical protein
LIASFTINVNAGWAAGAEKDKEEEKIGHEAAQAARSNLSA